MEHVPDNRCDSCSKEAELYYNEDHGLSFCEECDRKNSTESHDLISVLEEVANSDGITIRCYRKHRFQEDDSWSISGAGVNAAGFSTLEDAFQSWVDARKYLETLEKER